MKILAIIPSYKPAYTYGGPIQSVSALNEALVHDGHSVCVLTSNANGTENLQVELNKPYNLNGVEVFYFQRWTGDHSNFSPALLMEAWKRVKKVDAVHIHAWWNLISIPAVLICILRGIRPVLSPRGSVTSYTFGYRHSFLKSWFHALVGKTLLKRSLIHVTSAQEANDVNTFIVNAEIHTLPNILDVKDPEERLDIDEKELSLIYIGRIDPKKNIEFIFDIAREKFNYPCRLVFIGEGPKAYLDSLKQIDSGNIRIHWLGPIYDDTKWKYISCADILMLPSKNENYGNVVLEALSQGTAVMVSENVGLKDYVLANQLGWVPGDTPDAWRKQLDRIYLNRSILQVIRHKAPECIKRDFDQKKILQAYINLYQSTKIGS